MPAPVTAMPARRVDASSRLAGATPRTARWILATLAVALLLVALAAAPRPTMPAEQSATTIHAGLAEAVASGGDYYLAAAEALHAADRPVDPFGVRLPTLGLLDIALPEPVVTTLLWLLALMTGALWYRRIAGAAPRLVALALPLAGMAAVLRPGAVLVHEQWAGLLVASSLALARPGRWVETVALGLAAALIDQSAAVYLLAMAVLAVATGHRREAQAWAVGTVLFAIVFAFHAHAVVRAGGDWFDRGAGAAGPIEALRAIADATLLARLPDWLAVPLLVLAVAGSASVRGVVAARIGVTLVVFWLVAAARRSADIGDAALLAAPLSLVGLAFAVPALRALVVVALDRRRITVKRIVR